MPASTTPLSPSQIRHLRGLAHPLKPVVMVGNQGITEGLLQELEVALSAHELIKVKVRAEEREERDELIATLCDSCDAHPVQRIGHNLVLFRRNPEKPKVDLPK